MQKHNGETTVVKRLSKGVIGRILAAAVIAVLLTRPAAADPVAEPPESLRGQVWAVPELDVSGSDPALQQATAETRGELAALLADPAAERPAIGDAYGRLGAYYQIQAVTTAAERCYENAITLDPDEFRWHYYAGELLLGSGRAEEALVHFNRARALDPDYPPLRLKLARAAFDLNRIEQAEQEFRAIAEEPGLEAMAHYYLGRIALQRRDHEEAAGWFLGAQVFDSDADRLYYPLAQALRALGEKEQAREQLALHGDRLPSVEDPLLEELEALNSGARPHFIRAMAAVKRQEYAAAVADFAAGLELDPDNANARASYARALYLDGKTEQARTELERVPKLDPKNSLAPFLLALMLDESGDTKRAGKLYARTLELEPEHSGAHFFLAGRLYRDGDYTAAAGHYAYALQVNPGIDVAVLLHLVSLSRSGSTDAEIAAQLHTLLETRPDDPALRYAAGLLLALSEDREVRDPPRALELARTLEQQMPAPLHLELLALAHAANGDFEQARQAVQQLEFSLPPWVEGSDVEELKAALQVFEEGRIPGPPWPRKDPVLQPPPVQAGGPMREYPAALPY
jgi:tetratricopeptide (TPR) repeat protein